MNYFQRSHSRQSALDDSANPLPLDHAQWEKERERNWNRPRPKPFPHSPSVSLSTTMRRRDSMESLGSAPRDSMFGRRKRLESTSSVASDSSAVEAPSSALVIAPASRHGNEKPPGAALLSVSSSQLLLPFRPSSPTPGDTAASRKSTSPIPSAISTRIRTLSTPATVSKEKEREKETHWNMPTHARARSTHTTTPKTSPKQNSASSAKGVATSLLHRAQNFSNPSKTKDRERERGAGENASLHEPARSTSPSPTEASSSTGGSLAPIPYGEGFPRERKRSQTNGGTPFTSSSRGPSFRDSLKKVFKWSSKESSGSGEEPRASNPSSTPSRTKSGGDRDSGSNSSAELPAPDPIQPPGLAKREGPAMSENEVESKGDEGRNNLGSIPRLVSPTTTPRTSLPSTTPTTTPSHRTSSIPSRIPRASRVVAPGEPNLNSSGDTPSHANGNRHSLLPAKTPKFPSAWETPAATPAPTTSGSTLPTTPSAGPSRSGSPLPPYETPAETPVPEQASGVPSVYVTPAETPKISIHQTPAETPKTSVYQTPAETSKTSVYQTPAETPKPSGNQLPAETPVSRPDGKAPKTPAPPSGWMTTPHAAPTPAQGAWSLSAPYSAPQTPSVGSSSLKGNDSHQKVSRVRFDRSPSTSSIVSVGSGSDREMDGVPIAPRATTTHDILMPRFATGQTRDNQQGPQSSQQQQQQHQNGGSEQKRLPDEREHTPYRPPRVIVVDPFGREIYAEDGAPIERLDEPENEPLEPLVMAGPLPAPVQATNGSSKANGVASEDKNDSLAGISARRREKMRVDDAQANVGEHSVEITVPGDEAPKLPDAIEFMREGLSELENDTADESSSGPLAAAQPLTLSEPLEREERIRELRIQSESSRIERSKITGQSQLARINSVTSAEEVDQLRSGSSSSNHGHRSRSSTKSDDGASASSAVRSETAHAAQEPWWRPSYMLALLQGVVPCLALEWAEYSAEYLFLATHFDVAFPIMEDIPGFHWYSLPFPPSSFATRRDYHHL